MNHYFTDSSNLKSEIRVLNYSYEEYDFILSSDIGVFSKDKIDLGSKTLVEAYFKYGSKNKKVLDVGCGYGFIGLTIAKVMESEVDLVDINKRAIHLTNMNIKKNKIDAKTFISDAYESVTSKYDVIITNPPIRAGKSTYMKIINDSFNYLNENGELWFVMRNNHGVKTIYKELSKRIKTEIIVKNKGFYVIMAKID